MVKADSVGLGGADDEVLDFVFGLQGRAIAIDYADRLWRALRESMSWLADEPGAGVHPLAGVSAGDFELYLTRRARLILRLPGWRAKAAAGLVGQRLDLGGEVGVSAMSERRLWPARVLYASFVSVGESDEGRFLDAASRIWRPSVSARRNWSAARRGGRWVAKANGAASA